MKLLLLVTGGGVCLAVFAVFVLVIASEFSDEILADLDDGTEGT